MHKYQSVNGKPLPSLRAQNWLAIEHVLQRYREVWVLIETWPFLAVDVDRLMDLSAGVEVFPVFSGGRLLQNISPDEGAQRLMAILGGPGTNAGMSPDAEIVVEGMANPRAHWTQFFNEPFAIGTQPFAALHDRYIYVDGNGIYQRMFDELVIVDGYSRPRSVHVDFDPLAEMALAFHKEFVDGPRDQGRDMARLSVLLDGMFAENEKILAAATRHHRSRVPLEKPFDYVAPTLTRYGRLTNDANRQPRIEISFALLHYEKALRAFDDLKRAQAAGNTEATFVHGVYCVVAIAACVEAIANKLVYLQGGAHPDRQDRRQPLKKIDVAAAALAQSRGTTYSGLPVGDPRYDELERVRLLRNTFMHASERDEPVDPVALTSTVFTAVDEARCRTYLAQLRRAVAHVFDQLPDLAPPIVTRDNVKWLGDLEVP